MVIHTSVSYGQHSYPFHINNPSTYSLATRNPRLPKSTRRQQEGMANAKERKKRKEKGFHN
jgi:hypothetical protein